MTTAGRANRNNLDALRMTGAFLVVYGHCYALSGVPERHFLSWLTLGPLGVYIFFTISGYLVVDSWRRDPSLWRFFARRALRIFPGLIACVLLTVFVLGPLVTTLPLRAYLAHTITLGYLETIGLYIHYSLPGVFDTNPVMPAVNGSLWSLPVEFLMYVIVAVVGLLRGNRWVFLGLALVSAALCQWWAHSSTEMLVVYGSDMRQVALCGTYFWAGAVIREFRVDRFFTLSGAVIACVALVALEPWTTTLRVAAWALVPIVVMSFGLAKSPVLAALTRSGDYSYGVYIYSFPVQQTLLHLYPAITLGPFIAATSAVTLVMAMLSWHLVERPALAWKPRARATRTPVIASSATAAG